MLAPNRLTVLVLVALAASALAGCEAGTADADAGRAVAAETRGKRAQDPEAKATAKGKASDDERDREDADDDRSGTPSDDAPAASEETTAAAAYAQAELDAQGQAEPLPEVYSHVGTSREFPELPPDLALPDSVAAAASASASDSEPDPNSAPSIDAVSPSTAPASGGSELQIHGKNLQAYRVAVGFAPARILSVREAGGTVTLTVAAPPRTGPATVAIVVTNRDGSVAIASEPFQYYN